MLAAVWCSACSPPAASEHKPSNAACPETDVEARAECLSKLAEEQHSAAACAAVGLPKAHDDCLQRVAIAAGNFELCSGATDPLRRDKCRREVGTKKPSAAACGAISTPFLRDACYVELAASAAAPKNVCELVQTAKYACFSRAAERDPSQCERIGPSASSFARRRCYEKIIEHGTALSPQICGAMQDTLLQQQCLSKLAEQSHDSSRCAQLGLAEVADDCWAAFSERDGNACIQIKQADRRRQCASRNWVTATDPKLCASLVSEALRAACVKRTTEKHH